MSKRKYSSIPLQDTINVTSVSYNNSYNGMCIHQEKPQGFNDSEHRTSKGHRSAVGIDAV